MLSRLNSPAKKTAQAPLKREVSSDWSSDEDEHQDEHPLCSTRREEARSSRAAKPLLAALPRTSTIEASKAQGALLSPRRTVCRCVGYAALLLFTFGSVVIGYGVSELMKGERSRNVALTTKLQRMKTTHVAMNAELARQKELHGEHNSMLSTLTTAKGTLST